jgi:hypothetical protein
MENNIRYFQWVVGPRRGEVMIFDKIETDEGEIYIAFKDKSRINEKFVAPLNQKDLTGKMMAEIDNPNNCWKFKEKQNEDDKPRFETDANTGIRYEIPTAEEIKNAELTSEGGVTRPTTKSKKRTIELIPPRPTAPFKSKFGTISNVQSLTAQETKSTITTQEPHILLTPTDKTDPVYILMSKSKKVDNEISMNITISLPPQNLYNIAKESFDKGSKKFIEYIIENITVNEIKKAIKVAVTEMYENSNGPTIQN